MRNHQRRRRGMLVPHGRRDESAQALQVHARDVAEVDLEPLKRAIIRRWRVLALQLRR